MHPERMRPFTDQIPMSSTHLCLHYHIIFSTKNREPIISPTFRDQLHGFLVGAVQTLQGVSVAVGGTADHVHLLMRLRATHCLSDVIRDVKRASSVWVHQNHQNHQFLWQEGYGAFTVSPSQVETVKKYIHHQENYHRKQTFQEEYVEFLQRSGIEYDERFIWT